MAQKSSLKSSPKISKAMEFDTIVIGAGLEGLIAACQLEGTGRKVALLEAYDFLGGGCRPSQMPVGTIDYGLKFFPEAPEIDEALDWMEHVLGEKIERELIDAPPLTYDDGKFKPFVGFGDQKITTAHEVGAYAKSRFYHLSSTPKDWVPKLVERFTGTLLTQSIATKFVVEDSAITEILINGAKRITGREILFCATPQQLVRLLPEANVPPKIRQRLLKGEFWTSVNLDVVHRGTVTEGRAIHILKGANEEPSVGIFYPTGKLEDGHPAQHSQWMTLVPKDITDDSEHVAAALKQIKRQMKRAYENGLESIIKERIVVNPTSHGDFTGVLPDDGKWPKLQNLWVISGFMDGCKNTVGAIRQTRRTLADFSPEAAQASEPETDSQDAHSHV